MSRYNVNVAWDDPFDRVAERRTARRFEFPVRLSIRVDVPGQPTPLVGPGMVRDVSLSGACVVTKHALEEGQTITLAIPTDMCRNEICLPQAFVGSAVVVRVMPYTDGRIHAAVRFGKALVDNIEFALFIEELQTIAKALPRA